MALDFPTSPALNQVYTFGSYSWRWDGTSWVGAVPIVNATINNTTIGAVTPSTGAFTTLSATTPIASSSGGTGNGFAKFSGPASSEKTFTLPNASSTLLYEGGTIGATTANTGAFTTLSATGTLNIGSAPNANSRAWALQGFGYINGASGNGIEWRNSTTGNSSYITNDTGDKFTFNSLGGVVVSQGGLAVTGNSTATGYLGAFSGGDAFCYLGTTSGGGDYGYLKWKDSDDTINIGTNTGGDTITITEAGNVGIGVTPSAWTVFKVLQIGSGFAGASSGVTNARIFGNTYYDGSYRYMGTGRATQYEQDGYHAWYTSASGTAGNAISFTQAMTLDTSSRLGVNTTDASTGGGQMVVSQAQDNGIVINASTSSYSSTLYLRDVVGSNSAKIRFMSSNGLNFIDNSDVVKARIDSSGNLLVGTTSGSGNRVDIVGSNGCKISGWGAGVGTGLTMETTTTTSSDSISFTVNGTQIGKIQTTSSGTSYVTSSDYRRKSNVKDLIGSGAFIDALKPRTFDWDTGEKGVGFIAHEFAEVSPSSVSGEKDAVDNDGKPVYQGMQASSAEVIANLVAELQSVRQRLAALEA